MADAPEDAARPGRGAPPPRGKACGKCGSRFSGDARFCPFDGEPLGIASDGTRPPDPLIGTVVDGRYEVQALLGEGGMGTVYHVRHRALERAFAMKVLRSDLSRERDLGERFLREAKAAAAVSHPNVVRITDFGHLPSGQPYFVTELLVGESLSTVLSRGGPLPAARAVHLLWQIVDALGAAHGAGVVHRDLKPDNIFVCNGAAGDTAKVLDFGLAKVAGQSRLTRAGVVFGTPYYMSPEQASGGVVDERTDVYAVGVVMYEMFTGRVPFEADTYMGVLTKHLYVEPTPPSVILGGTSALGALEQITLRCLEKKPERRFRNMAALGAELRRVARLTDDGHIQVSPAEPGLEPRHDLADELELPTAAELRLSSAGEAWGRTLRVGVAAVVVVGATAAGVLYGLEGRSPSPPPPAVASSAAATVAAPVAGPVPEAATRPPPPTTGPDGGAPPPAVLGSAASPEAPASTPRATTRRPEPQRGPAGGSGARPGLASPAPVPAGKAKESLGSSGAREIVDPWSR